MIHKEELLRIRSIMIESKKDLEAELRTMPDGELFCVRNKGSVFYYERFPKVGNRKKEKRVGITRNHDKVLQLVRKEYLTKAIDIIGKNVRTLDMAIKHYKNADEESVMSSFLNKHPELREGIYHGIQNDEEWAEDYSAPGSFHEESLAHKSAQGSMMRSKNEVYIASRLDHYGIPYRYEAPIAHPDVTRVPDFTIKRPRDGKIIYWEHLGMPDNAEYMRDNERKLIEYRDAGITPWNNLIITYDMSSGNIDAKIIEAMIQGWLL